MAADWTTYLGVYLEVQDSKETEVEKYYVDETGNRHDTPFCPKTGTAYQEMTKKVVKTVCPSPDEIEGLPDDIFFDPEYSGSPKGYRTWIPNTNKYRVARMAQHEDNHNKSFEETDIMVEFMELKKKLVHDYSEYLQAISKKFNFTVKFGLAFYAD